MNLPSPATLEDVFHEAVSIRSEMREALCLLPMLFGAAGGAGVTTSDEPEPLHVDAPEALSLDHVHAAVVGLRRDLDVLARTLETFVRAASERSRAGSTPPAPLAGAREGV